MDVPEKWLNNVTSFFDETNLLILHNINYKQEPFRKLSLRKINFFVIVHSKLHHTYINKQFSIYQEYLSQLKIWRRKFFDPFRRGNFIMTYSLNGTVFWTTFPQLNFFKWFIETRILEYMLQNMTYLNSSMTELTKAHKKFKEDYQNDSNVRKRIMFCKHEDVCTTTEFKETFTFNDVVTSKSSTTTSDSG